MLVHEQLTSLKSFAPSVFSIWSCHDNGTGYSVELFDADRMKSIQRCAVALGEARTPVSRVSC